MASGLGLQVWLRRTHQRRAWCRCSGAIWSTTCKQCSRGAGESPVLQPRYLSLLSGLDFGVFGRDLDSDAARRTPCITRVLHPHGVDARVAERYHKLDLRKNVTESQILPT